MSKNNQKQPAHIDNDYISAIFHKLTDKIDLLDSLNQQYKQKQQVHFLNTFMAVIEKLGNELIFAQEAYKNVDIEAKKDNYCLLIAEELNFYKNQAMHLSGCLSAANQALKKMKIEKDNMQNELHFTRNLLEKQTSSNMKLKNEVKQLKKQLKTYTSKSKNLMNDSSATSQRFHPLVESKKQLSLGRKVTLKHSPHPKSMELSEQNTTLTNYETCETFQFQRKNRNSVTLSPVGENNKLGKTMKVTENSFRARKQERELKRNVPEQYLVV